MWLNWQGFRREDPNDPVLALVGQLRAIVGHGHVLTTPIRTQAFREGFRSGSGPAAAVVFPGSLVELWRVANACVQAHAVMILQAANTGLTGGSTPDGDDYGRPVIVISVRRLSRIHVLGGGRQVICLAGATLFDLERTLEPLGRDPHSVIGSSCIGATVVGGVCNNSGGALVRRGPAYTEMALYGALGEDGIFRLVNDLGIAVEGDAETVLARIERGGFDPEDIDWAGERRASDTDYPARVRDIDAPTPARYNADPRCLHSASGCAGRLVVFAVRLDSFPRETDACVFYVGTNTPAAFAALRRSILSRCSELPIAGEYMHRTAFDIAAQYGKDMFLALQYLGTRRLPLLFAVKRRVDRIARRLGFRSGLSDRAAQWLAACAPAHLPERLLAYRDRFEHHLTLKVSGTAAAETRTWLDSLKESGRGDYFACTPEEGTKAFLHRFAAAGAAIRYREIHAAEVADIIALDIALPRNAEDWFEQLPADIGAAVICPLYYGHFFCYVFHQDYLMAKGADVESIKERMLATLKVRSVQYPAEHNFGHLYTAPSTLVEHYRQLDPRNALNPGIGKTSKRDGWGD